MTDRGEPLVGQAPVETQVETPPTEHTLVVAECGDPAVDLNGGVVRLGPTEHEAVLPKPLRIAEDDEEEDGPEPVL
jgi:hypothetical protein